MTDNRTTELLCKLLEERGIEWKDGDAAYEIEWITPDGRHCSAMYWNPTFTVLISGCTPEQAIAATLGGQPSEAFAEMRDTVRDAFSGESVSMLVEGNAIMRAIDKAEAATLSGECEQVLTDCEDGLMPPFTAHCSKCGEEWGFTPKYCHNCGAKVTGTRDDMKAVK